MGIKNAEFYADFKFVNLRKGNSRDRWRSFNPEI